MSEMNRSTPQGRFERDIQVEVKHNFGTEHIYVVSHHATAISHITGRKTVTRADINALKALGFHFENVSERVDF
jgi:hypothetical protein